MANLLYRAKAEETIERGKGWRAELPRFEDYREPLFEDEPTPFKDGVIARGFCICFAEFYYN